MHHLSTHTLQSFFKNQLNELYISMAFRSFAFSLVDIFIPIYLLMQGYSLRSVFLFYVVVHAVHALCAYPSARIALRFGFWMPVLASSMLFILFFFFLHTIGGYHWPLWLLGIINGAANPLFWMAYHIDFVSCSDAKKRGQEVGTVKIMNIAATAFAPALGALIISLWGFPFLISIVSLILALSTIPLVFSKNRSGVSDDIRLSDIFHHQTIREALNYFGHGIDQGLGVVWAVFIFLTISQTLTVIGLASSIALSCSFLSIFFIGKFSNHHARSVLAIGGVGTSLTWIARLLYVNTPFLVYATNAIGGIFTSAVIVPFSVIVYGRSSDQQSCRPLITGEILFHVGKVALFSFLAIATNFWGAFLAGAIVPLVYFLF
ncbi:MAG: hypothetical protein Q8P56_02020 [Candidatus Uhrbacteria bacterium]|nr:hypothetical protein [Candidatus Uhrbacteria bacterium]